MSNKRFVATKVEVEGREETRLVELPAFDPAPWTTETSLEVVGQCVPRMDAIDKVTGRAKYTTDIGRAGMLHVAIIRASIHTGVILFLLLRG